jgi:hypothetical protein
MAVAVPPKVSIAAPQHPTYNVKQVGSTEFHLRAWYKTVTLIGVCKVCHWVRCALCIRRRTSSILPLAQVIKAALDEDAGDRGDVTTQAT